MRSKACKLTELNILRDNMTIMCGGFGGVGSPPSLIDWILDSGIKNITLICNDAGFPWIGTGKLVTEKRVSTLIASHIGSNPEAGKQMHRGELNVHFYPQGTLAEKIRAGGMGLGGILVDVGLGTSVEEGKEKTYIHGREYMIEPALTADLSIVACKQADLFGNLLYDQSARNTNPLMAQAGDLTIAEAAEIVQIGELDPEQIVTQGVFVDHVIKSKGVDWKWVWELKREG